MNVAPRETLFGIKSWCDTKSWNGVELEKKVFMRRMIFIIATELRRDENTCVHIPTIPVGTTITIKIKIKFAAFHTCMNTTSLLIHK